MTGHSTLENKPKNPQNPPLKKQTTMDSHALGPESVEHSQGNLEGVKFAKPGESTPEKNQVNVNQIKTNKSIGGRSIMKKNALSSADRKKKMHENALRNWE
jgi:hypothetical protein